LMLSAEKSVTQTRRRVRLACRLRPVAEEDTPMASPLLASPLSRRRTPGLQFATVEADSNRGVITVTDPMSPSQPFPQEYRCDVVHDQSATNADVFASIVEPLIDEAIATLKASPPTMVETLCFLAYGQTGSGKTHTVFGDIGGEQGLIQSALQHILRRSSGASVVASFVEIYDKYMFDLLDGGAKRDVRQHKVHGCYVPDLTTVELVSTDDWEPKCHSALLLRRSGKSSVNARSSRSHALVTFRCHGLRVCFVDLAGSERQDGVLAAPLSRESVAINESLTALSRVIQQLAEGKQAPTYRESMLTVLLQRYLAGSSATTFLCCLHPSPMMIHESLSTLRYARRIKSIATYGPTLSSEPTTPLIAPNTARPGDAKPTVALTAAQEALRAELQKVRDQATRVQAAQRDRIRELEGEVASLRLGSTTATANTSIDTSHFTVDSHHNDIDELEDIIDVSTVGADNRGGAAHKQSTNGVRQARGQVTPPRSTRSTPPSALAGQTRVSPSPQRFVQIKSPGTDSSRNVGNVSNVSSVRTAHSASALDDARLEEMRCTRLLSSWFTRRVAALRTAPPPKLPTVSVEYDEFFDVLNSETREVISYLVTVSEEQEKAEAAGGKAMKTYCAVLPVSRELLQRRPGDDEDTGGDAAATLVNLLRWGLPPLFPLHEAQLLLAKGSAAKLRRPCQRAV
jgi:hypothetical protein